MIIGGCRSFKPYQPRPLDSQAPIARLTLDVLEDLLLLVVASDHLRTAARTAAKLGLVCHTWYAIVSDTGRFWAYVSSWSSPEALEHIFARSKTAPLVVSVNTRNVGSSSIILGHVQRIRELFVVVSGRVMFCRENTPNLRRLSLNLCDLALSMSGQDVLRDWDTPKLVSLRLSQGSLYNVAQFLQRRLTHLSLTSVYVDDASLLIKSLRALPTLEELRLIKTIPQDLHHTPVDETIYLPSLRNLRVEDTQANCIWMVDHLDVFSYAPPTIELIVQISAPRLVPSSGEAEEPGVTAVQQTVECSPVSDRLHLMVWSRNSTALGV